MGKLSQCATTRGKPVSMRCDEDSAWSKFFKKRKTYPFFNLENSYLSFKAQFSHSLSVKSSWALDHSLTLWVSCPDAPAPTACCKFMCAEFVCALSCLTLCNPMDCASQVPLSMGVFRQEYWSGLPFPSPGVLPDTGIEASSAPPSLAVIFFTNATAGTPLFLNLSWFVVILCFYCDCCLRLWMSSLTARLPWLHLLPLVWGLVARGNNI